MSKMELSRPEKWMTSFDKEWEVVAPERVKPNGATYLGTRRSDQFGLYEQENVPQIWQKIIIECAENFIGKEEYHRVIRATMKEVCDQYTRKLEEAQNYERERINENHESKKIK